MTTAAGFLQTEGADWSYSENSCFLCLDALDESNRSKEHVFPMWLLNRHGLINETMTLQNGTTMPYRQLTIPCCLDCNGTHLSQMENTVKEAFKIGFDGVRSLDRRILFLWLAKIFYGLLIKERSSLLDRRATSRSTIVRDEDLSRFAMHHFLLQNVLGTAGWVAAAGENPWSIFVLKCQISDTEPHLNFDYVDSNDIPFLAIRSGEVAVIAGLQDWGHLENAIEVRHLAAAQQLELHPLQFKEAAVVAGYLSIAFFQTRRFMLLQGEKQTTAMLMPRQSAATNFEPELIGLAPSLAHHFQVDLDQVTDGRRVISTLSSPDGSPFHMHWDGSSNYPKPSIHPAGTQETMATDRV
jgi:hypothetical protein